MSTATVGAGALTGSADNTGTLSQEKRLARHYVKYGNATVNGETRQTLDKRSTVQESDKKEPETIKDAEGKAIPNPYAGQPVSFANAERSGLEVFSENEYIQYSVKSWEGAALLIPDEAQRLYIFQNGLSNYQTSRIQASMKELVEDATEPTPLYNGVTIDLAVGITNDDGTVSYSIQQAPQRKSMSDEDKLIKQLRAMGTPEDKISLIVALMNQKAPAADEEEEAA